MSDNALTTYDTKFDIKLDPIAVELDYYSIVTKVLREFFSTPVVDEVLSNCITELCVIRRNTSQEYFIAMCSNICPTLIANAPFSSPAITAATIMRVMRQLNSPGSFLSEFIQNP